MSWWQRFFPFSYPGRQTLVYLVFAGAGPALTAAILWSMYEIRWWAEVSPDARLGAFYKLARIIAWAVFLVISALATFVAFRALKIGKAGLEATARDDEEPVAVTVTNPPSNPVPVESQ